jgi:very-short-patch-repair endonuclease
MIFKKGNEYWKLRKRTGFIKGNKNPKLSEIRKKMFSEGLLDVSGIKNGMYGKHPSYETRIKLSKASKNRKHKKHSEESKRKISLAHKGKKLTEEHKRKIGMKGKLNPMHGKNHSEESVKKIKEARKNQKNCYTTSIEIKIQNFLKKLNIEFFTHQYINIEHGYQCDILIPSINLVIECDGDYWHKYPIGREIDQIRTSELLEKGFKVLRLWECEINKMSIKNFQNKLGEYSK